MQGLLITSMLLIGGVVGFIASTTLFTVLIHNIVVKVINEYNKQLEKIIKKWEQEELKNLIEYFTKKNELTFDINQLRLELARLQKEKSDLTCPKEN